jgi:hypothetical protein
MLMRNILLLCLLVLAACNNPKPKSDITDIELIINNSTGPTEITEINIDSTLNYHFYGGWATGKANGVINNGGGSGKINSVLWDTLTNRLQQIDYEKLKRNNGVTINAQELVIIVHYKNRIEHVKAQDLPSSESNIFYDVANSYTTGKLQSVK